MVIEINTAKNRQQEFWRIQPVGLWSSWSVSDSEFHYLDSIIHEPLILKKKEKRFHNAYTRSDIKIHIKLSIMGWNTPILPNVR